MSATRRGDGRHLSAASFFDERAAWYDSQYDGVDANGHALRTRMAATLQLAGRGPGTALDAGMGPGRLCGELARAGWTVSGVDASAEMVDFARNRLPDARVRLVQAPIEALPFPDESFDLVTATGVLEYSDMTRALDELARVLRPGGRAVVSYPNPRAYYGIWKTSVWYPAVRALKRLLRRGFPNLPRGAGRLPPEEFRRRLELSGFTPISSIHTSYLLLFSPIDEFLPRLSAALGGRLEGRPGLARRFANQVVYGARKDEA